MQQYQLPPPPQCSSNDSIFLIDDEVLSIISDQVGIPIERHKIEKLLKQNLFKDLAKLVIWLCMCLAAEVVFDEETVLGSSLT